MDHRDLEKRVTAFTSCSDSSFLGIFSFEWIDHEAIDKCIVYNSIIVEQNCPNLSLSKGDEFYQVIFNMQEGTFTFCNWNSWRDAALKKPPARELMVPQLALAPYMK